MNPQDLRPHPLNLELYGEQEPDDGLLESIRRHGILEPLVIKSDGTIISGHRRWRAALALGLTNLPYFTVDFKDELDEQERLIEYNRQREKTFSQKMAEAEKLKAIEAERARRRMSEAAKAQHEHMENSTGKEILSDLQKMEIKEESKGVPTLAPLQKMETDKGKTRDKVAAQIGMSHGTLAKAETVWRAAKQGDERAKELVKAIDAGKTTINKAYNEIREKTEFEQEYAKALEEFPELKDFDKKDAILAAQQIRAMPPGAKTRALEAAKTWHLVKDLPSPEESVRNQPWSILSKAINQLEVFHRIIIDHFVSVEEELTQGLTKDEKQWFKSRLDWVLPTIQCVYRACSPQDEEVETKND